MFEGLRRMPRVVWWVTALQLALLLAYSVLLPTYRAPDEPEHVDLAHFFAETGQYPDWDERNTSPGVLRSEELVHFSAGSRHLRADAAPPRQERPAIAALEQTHLAPVPVRPNQLPQHPPLYYMLAGGIERVVELAIPDPSFDLETWLFRLVSVLLVSPLPLLIWQVAKLLALPASVGVAAMLVPLAVPQFVHIGAAVNNDSLLLLLFWLLTPLVVLLARGRPDRQLQGLAAVVTGTAMLTKGFALVMPFWVVAALVTGWWRDNAGGRPDRAEVRRLAGMVGLYLGVTFVSGGWWWLRNLVLYRQVSPTRYYELYAGAPPQAPDLVEFARTWAYLSTQLFWGNVGWLDVAVPTMAFALATAVCLVGLARVCAHRDGVAGTARGDRLLLAMPLAMLVVTQLGLALRAHLSSGLMAGLQGRYWFGALAAVAVAVSLGLANLLRGWRGLPLVVLAGAVVMQTLAISRILGHFWGPAGSSLADRGRAVLAWAPVTGELVVLGWVAGAVAAVGVASSCIGVARRLDLP